MSENEQENQLAQSVADVPAASVHGDDGCDKSISSEYRVGKYHPPIDKQFKPGQSGNPKGRPRGRPNVKTMVERALEKPISVRLDGKTRTVPMLEAIVYAQGAKAVQGDARSAGFVFGLLSKTGAFMDAVAGQETTAVGQQAVSRPPSFELFENIDQTMLSEDDQVELSRLAEIVDLGGGITALNVTDFSRARDLVNKGRGKDVTPST